MFYPRKDELNKRKDFRISANKVGLYLTSPLEWFYSSLVGEVMLNAMAEPSCLIRKTLNSVPVVEKGLNEKGL